MQSEDLNVAVIPIEEVRLKHRARNVFRRTLTTIQAYPHLDKIDVSMHERGFNPSED